MEGFAMPIKTRSGLGEKASQDRSLKVPGHITYGERTKDKEFNGFIEVATTSIVIKGHSVLETFNQDNQRYYDRKGSDLTLKLDVSVDQMLELSRFFAEAALKRQKNDTAFADEAYKREREKRIELESQVEALKKAFKAGA